MSRNRWLIVAFFVVVLLGISAALWKAAFTAEPGTRVSIVWPGGGASFAMGGARQLDLGPELVQQRVKAEIIAVRGESRQTFIIRREQLKLEIEITTGDRAIQPGDLHYELHDIAGEKISAGHVHHEKEIAPNTKGKCIIADVAVQDATKVRIVGR